MLVGGVYYAGQMWAADGEVVDAHVSALVMVRPFDDTGQFVCRYRPAHHSLDINCGLLGVDGDGALFFICIEFSAQIAETGNCLVCLDAKITELHADVVFVELITITFPAQIQVADDADRLEVAEMLGSRFR